MPNLFSPEDLSEGYLFNEEFDELIFNNIENCELIELKENLIIKHAVNENYKFIKLENIEGKCLSVLRLKKITIHNAEYYIVDKSHSIEKGKGYVVPLYEYAFCYLEVPIISDSIQTKPGSSNLWKKFQKKQENSPYEIHVFNTITNNQSIFITKNYNDYDVWGWPKEYIKLLNEAPDFISNKTEFEDFENIVDTTSFDTYDLEQQIQDELVTNYSFVPQIHPKLEKYLRLGGKRLKDREHILLLGKRKIIT